MKRPSMSCFGAAVLTAGTLLGLACNNSDPLPDPCASVPGMATTSQGADCPVANPVANPVVWKTPSVFLSADDFWIVADGAKFTSKGAAVDVHSDPGNPKYTTLELTWNESGREMRFFLYFSADPSGWQVDEMRTYNAQKEADWLYYEGPLFRSSVGASYTGDVDLTNSASDPIRGSLHLHGLRLATSLTGQ